MAIAGHVSRRMLERYSQLRMEASANPYCEQQSSGLRHKHLPYKHSYGLTC